MSGGLCGTVKEPRVIARAVAEDDRSRDGMMKKRKKAEGKFQLNSPL